MGPWLVQPRLSGVLSEHMDHVARLAWQQEVRQAQHEELRGDARRTEVKVDALVARLDLFRRDKDREQEIRDRERVEALEEAQRDDDRRMEERVEARAVRLDNAGAKADPCMDRTRPDVAPIRGIVYGYLLCASWLRGLLSSRRFRQGACGVALAVYLLLFFKRLGQGVEIQGVEIHATTTASLSILKGPLPSPRSGTRVVIAALALIVGVQAVRIAE
ncbi:hypothetical protein C7212DRAFT_340448 [Tuber magnatum]|uniref:Uncharacterized protein n=1 Tax=Tuber magnatum TaxID=42249 RepID=A0A317T0S9_9PEZI|nr:hypothetical protein C7212DRAFT_340448 [Tuber magnatum]